MKSRQPGAMIIINDVACYTQLVHIDPGASTAQQSDKELQKSKLFK